MLIARSTGTSKPRIDWQAIKDRIDIRAVAVALLGEPPKAGPKWHCPFHRDRDPSFGVSAKYRSFRCFSCGERGDAVKLIRRLNPQMSFPEAARLTAELSGIVLSIEGTAPKAFTPLPVKAPVKAPARPPDGPKGLSPSEALIIVADASQRLWASDGIRALEYLHDRGLTDDTIRRARLGCKVGDQSCQAAGIVVPWFDGDRLALVKVRQGEGRTPKYLEVFRDRPRAFPSPDAIRPGKPLVIVEGEFDALLLAQEIGDAASVVTLGSATVRFDPTVLTRVRCAPRWYIATDADDAGDIAAARWESYPRARRVRPSHGAKDWTELHANDPSAIRCIFGPLIAPTEPRPEPVRDQKCGPDPRPEPRPDPAHLGVAEVSKDQDGPHPDRQGECEGWLEARLRHDSSDEWITTRLRRIRSNESVILAEAAAEPHNFSPEMVYAARDALGVKEYDIAGSWWWKLPEGPTEPPYDPARDPDGLHSPGFLRAEADAKAYGIIGAHRAADGTWALGDPNDPHKTHGEPPSPRTQSRFVVTREDRATFVRTVNAIVVDVERVTVYRGPEPQMIPQLDPVATRRISEWQGWHLSENDPLRDLAEMARQRARMGRLPC